MMATAVPKPQRCLSVRVALGSFMLLALAVGWADPALASRRMADGDRDDGLVFDRTSERLAFDSGFWVGIGSWRTPALPRLITENEYQRLDIANYTKESAALAAVIETRLFFPFVLMDLPLGFSLTTSQALTESSALSFTVSPNKSAIRPKHNLALNLGLRADYSVGQWGTESSLEVLGNHIVYLGANITAIGPGIRFRAHSGKAFSVIPWMGGRPVLSFEGSGAPFLSVSNYDNRITTESGGTIREFQDLVQLSKSAGGWMYGAQFEGGIGWVTRDQGREQEVVLIVNTSQYHLTGLLERVIKLEDGSSSVSKLDANSVMTVVAIGFRSAFL